MLTIAHLLSLADAYQSAVRVQDKTLSFRVFGDSKKLTALRADADITTQRFNAALIWFADNWPEGLDWPPDVPRVLSPEAFDLLAEPQRVAS